MQSDKEDEQQLGKFFCCSAKAFGRFRSVVFVCLAQPSELLHRFSAWFSVRAFVAELAEVKFLPALERGAILLGGIFSALNSLPHYESRFASLCCRSEAVRGLSSTY